MFSKQRRRIPSRRRKVVWYRDGGRCRYCKTHLEYITFHLDHVVPVYHNGHDYVTNLCAACVPCNLRKGANKNIRPRELSLLRKVYALILVLWYRDYPRIVDFF